MKLIKPDTSYLMQQYERLYAQHEKRISASLDRCTKALHHQQVDRLPVWKVSQTGLYPRHELFYDKEKNRNFRAIIEAIEFLQKKIENGEDVCDNKAYKRYAVP